MESPTDDFGMATKNPTEEDIGYMSLFFNDLGQSLAGFESAEDYFNAVARVLSPENDKERFMTEFNRTVAINDVTGEYDEFQVDEENNYRSGHVKIREKTVLSERGNPDAWLTYLEDSYHPEEDASF